MARNSARGPTIHFSVRRTQYEQYVRNLQTGWFEKGNQAVREAGEASVTWLGNAAAGRLEDQIKRAPDPRHKRLADILRDPSVSSATVGGFQFLIAERVRELDRKVAAYYRAVEYGSDYWVRRTARRKLSLGFVGFPEQATGDTPPVQAGYAPAGFGLVRIRNPIPAYHYITGAVDDFKRDYMFAKFLVAALNDKGIKATFKQNAGRI